MPRTPKQPRTPKTTTVKQLQEECKSLGLSPYGRKTELLERLQEVRDDAELTWMQPFSVVYYFITGLIEYFKESYQYLLVQHSGWLLPIVGMVSFFIAGSSVDNPYQKNFQAVQVEALWYGWWVILGIASSIGLGTGLHTFVLFLGPLIAEVAVFAQTCPSLKFHLHGAKKFICQNPMHMEYSMVDVYKKIALVAFAWGAGTAIGELPPYFVARGAALAGQQDEALNHIEVIKKKKSMSVWERIQLIMFNLLQRYGFFGILLCASIPNPLFDLAGITCGHFLVPFATFFGATFIGKSVFKAAIQSWSIILIFTKGSLESLMDVLLKFAPQAHDHARAFIAEQRNSFQRSLDGTVRSKPNSLISLVWNTFIVVMILYFVQSIVLSVANSQRRKSK